MNTVQLECFVTVAEHLNFSEASKVLKITQPAVSHQIQTLEEELNVKLFVRTSKYVSLTPEGILFLPDARLILKTALSARERLGTQERFLHLDLGCHNQMELNLLPPVLKRLTEDFPQLHPSVMLVPFPSLLQMTENRQVHAALSIKEEQNKTSLYFKEIFSAPTACICSPAHPLASFKSLAFEQLLDSQFSENFIACSPRHISGSVFAIHSRLLTALPLERKYLTQSIESALTLAKAQIGYTLYPDILQARMEGLHYIPVSGVPRIHFGIYCQRNPDYPVLKRFLALMAEELRRDA